MGNMERQKETEQEERIEYLTVSLESGHRGADKRNQKQTTETPRGVTLPTVQQTGQKCYE